MIRQICRDPILLSQKAKDACADDIPIANDLCDTLKANSDRCVGMAANMIGYPKKIIVFFDGDRLCEMFNPEILSHTAPFEAEDGCLSLSGTRKTKRFGKIRVKWQDRLFRTRIASFSGWTAQIVQHEIDHLSGILI